MFFGSIYLARGWHTFLRRTGFDPWQHEKCVVPAVKELIHLPLLIIVVVLFSLLLFITLGYCSLLLPVGYIDWLLIAQSEIVFVLLSTESTNQIVIAHCYAQIVSLQKKTSPLHPFIILGLMVQNYECTIFPLPCLSSSSSFYHCGFNLRHIHSKDYDAFPRNRTALPTHPGSPFISSKVEESGGFHRLTSLGKMNWLPGKVCSEP